MTIQLDYKSVIEEVFDNLGEHLEMLHPAQQPIAVIETMAKMVARERQEKEYYIKFYEKYRGR